MSIVYLILIILTALASIYFAFKSIEFRKFLAGAFFVSGGIQLYLAFLHVSIPVAGTTIVQDASLGYTRGIMHIVLSLVCIYYGFIRKKK
ncbi:MAG: hypothetical protein RI922_2747 [Bacteroidota bacterium]|jgi:hypothetical protein